MVDVASGYGERTWGFPLVHLRLKAEGEAAPVVVEILCDKLIRAGVGGNDLCLYGKKIRHQFSLEFPIFLTETGVDGAAHVGKIFPRIDAVAPVIKPPRLI